MSPRPVAKRRPWPLLLVLLLTACVPGFGGQRSNPVDTPLPVPQSATPSPTPAADRAIPPLWVSEQNYLSGGAVVQDRVLVLAPGGEEGWIDLAALEKETGKEVWRRPWSPHAGSRTGEFAVIEADNQWYAVFVTDGGERPGEDSIPYQKVISVRLSDGETKTVVEEVYLRYAPMRCAFGADRACLAVSPNGGNWSWVQWSPATGDSSMRKLPFPMAHLLNGWSHTLTDLGLPDPNEQFGLVRDGQVKWLVDSQQTFGSRLETFHLDQADRDALVVVAAAPNELRDLGGTRMVGLRPQDGAVAWRRDGVFACEPYIDSEDEQVNSSISMCEGTGKVDEPGATMTLALIDKTSGRTLRSFTIDAVQANLDRPDASPMLPLHHTVVTSDGRRQVLDTRTGASVELKTEGMLCWVPVNHKHRLHAEPRRIGTAVKPCQGEDRDRTLPANLMDVQGDKGFATALRDGKVYAYRL